MLFIKRRRCLTNREFRRFSYRACTLPCDPVNVKKAYVSPLKERFALVIPHTSEKHSVIHKST